MSAQIDVAQLRQQLAHLSAALKAAEPALRREMLRALRKAAEPVKTAQQDAVRGLESSARGGGGMARALYAAENYRGSSVSGQARAAERARGLRESAANAVKIQARTGRSSAGVNIVTRSAAMPPDQRRLPRYMDRGSWRHPVFGNQKAWVEQTTTPSGWFLDTGRKMQPQTVRELSDTINRFWAAWAARN